VQGISQAMIFQDNGSTIKGKVNDINGLPLPGAGITIEKHNFWSSHRFRREL